jgi:hypothetical protein
VLAASGDVAFVEAAAGGVLGAGSPFFFEQAASRMTGIKHQRGDIAARLA